MWMNTKRFCSLCGLIVVATLLAGCGGEMTTAEVFPSLDEPSPLASVLITPRAQPFATSPAPVPLDETASPTATAKPRATASPQVTPTAPTEEISPMETRSTEPPAAEEAIQAARAFLARRLEIPAEGIELLSVEARTWSDSSLGCPRPGYSYLQVIVPGYRIVLSAENRRYELHADTTGRQIVLCPGLMPGGRAPLGRVG